MSIGIFQNKNNQPPRTVDLSIQKKLSQENSQSTSCPSQQQSTQNIITQQPQKPTHRSSHRRCSLRKGILRNFAKFIGKRPCQSFFFRHGYFPVNFEKFLRTPFSQNTSGRLLRNSKYRRHINPRKKRNILFTDSIPKGINMRNFNSLLREAKF